MEQKPDVMQNIDPKDTTHSEKKLNLPMVALMLNIIPYFLFLIWRDVFMLFFISIFPIAGFKVGIVALCHGKRRIGTLGQVISVIAIAWPLVFIASTILLGSVGALVFNM